MNLYIQFEILTHNNLQAKEMLDRIQNELIKQYPQLQKKTNIFQYYISLQNTQKQRKLILWWQQLIEAAIRKSDQIFLSPADLEIIFSLHGLKPVPLQKVLQYLTQTNKFEWIGRQKQQKTKQNTGGWLGGITNYLWKSNNQNSQKNSSLGKSGFKSLQLHQDQKIIPKRYKQELEQKIIQSLQKQLKKQNIISYDFFYNIIKNQLKINIPSIDFLISQLQEKNIIRIVDVQNKRILIHSQNKKLMSDQKWIQVEKSKYILKSTIQLFDRKIENRLKQQNTKLQQAKQYIDKDSALARRILGQIRATSKMTNQLQNRRRLMKQTLDQLQINQINSTTIDVISECQKIIQKTMVDAQRLQAVKDKNLEISFNQKEINQFMASMENKEDIQNQVDNMMAELQKQINKNKKEKQEFNVSNKKQVNYQID